MSYSSVRVDEQHGTHPSITPYSGEVIISVTPVWDSSMNNTRWFICYGHPYMNPTNYSNESQLQIHINNQQYLINDLQRANDEYTKHTSFLEKFIDDSGLRETYERTLQEERIKRELSTGMFDPCPPPEVESHPTSAYTTVSSY